MAIGTQRITPEEFERFIMLAENTDKRFELIGGRLSRWYQTVIRPNVPQTF
jgi:hypothetical protein